jgi:ATPase family associated with various cellular activities (AAA)
MFPQEIASTLTTIFKQDTRSIVVFLQGPPGIGKTAAVGQAAQSASKELITFALPTCESVDLRGLPTAEKGVTKWASPLPRDGQGVILLDELSSAAPDVQVAAHHLVHAEPGSDMSLPERWHIVLTGNRAADKTLFRATSGPLRNRLTILNCEPDVKQWAEWAMDNDVSPIITAFVRWRPELLMAKEIPGDGGFPSPRSWEAVSNILSLQMSSSVERELILGTIGEAASIEFGAYLRTSRELPAIEAILESQAKAQVPKSPAQLYALATSLAQYTRERQESAMKYVSRMPAEFALLYVMDVRRGGHYDIRKDKEIGKWIGEHSKLFEMGMAA